MADIHSFWIINLEDTRLQVALITATDGQCQVRGLGNFVDWSAQSAISIDQAIDESLSQAATVAHVPPQSEASGAAFIVPPFWVAADGKIIADKLKLIEVAAHRLQLQPLGFIAADDAVVEAANLKEGLPSSFILAHIDAAQVMLSLTYLGKVKKRLRQSYSGDFSPAIIESGLAEMAAGSALPPQITLTGSILTPPLIDQIKNYPWIGKKNLEAFLHLPQIGYLSDTQLLDIYIQVISKQINVVSRIADLPSPIVTPPLATPSVDSGLDEVDLDELGFKIATPSDSVIPATSVIPSQSGLTEESLFSPPVAPSDSVIPSSPVIPSQPRLTEESFSFHSHRFRPSLPKIHLPHLKFNAAIFLIIFILAAPIALFVYLSKVSVTVYVTPYSFDQKETAIFDAAATTFTANPLTIPVTQKSLTTVVSASVSTTGKKTVGDKAKGEITIFNKSTKAEKLSSGTVFTDSTGLKYLLVNDISAAPSTSDLSQGIITLGQVKAVVAAADIGPEYNLAKDSQLTSKNDNILAKVNTTFTGGSKRQVNTVAAVDKTTLSQQLTSQIKTALEEKVTQQTANLSGLIDQSLQTKTDAIDYSREVGEEADELTGTVNATATVMLLDDANKTSLVNQVLATDPQFKTAQINPADFQLVASIANVTGQRASGTIEVKGQASPVIDQSVLTTRLRGQTLSSAKTILKSISSRVYDFQIVYNPLSPLKWVGLLPFRSSQISIIITSR